VATRRRTGRNGAQERGYLRELAALSCIALATLLTLSLVSYDPLDDTLLSSNPDRPAARNYVGPAGANAAAVLFQLLGFAAYLVPVTLFVVGGCLALRIGIPAVATKAVGVAGLLASTAVILALTMPWMTIAGIVHPFPGGGVVGMLLVEQMRFAFSDLAIHVIAWAVLAISLLLSTHFSFGKVLREAWSGIASLPARLRQSSSKRTRPRRETAAGRKAPLVKVRLRLGWPWRRRGAERADKGPVARPADGGEAEDDDERFEPVVLVPPRRRSARAVATDGRLPPIGLLDEPPPSHSPLNLKMLTKQARVIVKRYREFGIEGEVLQTNPGPVVNTFEFRPAAGVKYSKVAGLGNELCMALRAVSVRINRLPGKSTIGIEVPNHGRELIHFREMVDCPEYQHSASPLTLALGKLINGDPYVTRLDEMPHLLIAGATGAGKSVAINTMICSILYKATPETVRFILIDPKQVELNIYDGIPHLLTPVLASPKRAASALRWACEEMDSRYQRLAAEGTRNIEQYNRVASEARRQHGDPEAAIEPMPYIVIAIDELADLMMVSSVEVEESICRLAQKARAIGIHLIVATQRPSVDVLTGVIKANFQCRISFRVATKVDSRTILDCNGAESLLGDGDMLFLPPRTSRLIRVHGPFINDREARRIVKFLSTGERRRTGERSVVGKGGAGGEAFEDILEPAAAAEPGNLAPARDPLYNDAVSLVMSTGVASISNLQRKMRLGYARAARIIDTMESEGIVGPADGSKPREILKKQLM